MHSFFLFQSSKIGNSILDWIRSIYFSLLGSSVLNFSLKLSTYGPGTIIIYLFGNVLLLLGLIYSVKITKRFKDYDKSWPVDVRKPKDMPLDTYCREQDRRYSWQHTLLYTLWLPAIVCIGVVGFITEREIRAASTEREVRINRIESGLERLGALSSDLDKVRMSVDALSENIKKLNMNSPEKGDKTEKPTNKSRSSSN